MTTAICRQRWRKYGSEDLPSITKLALVRQSVVCLYGPYVGELRHRWFGRLWKLCEERGRSVATYTNMCACIHRFRRRPDIIPPEYNRRAEQDALLLAGYILVCYGASLFRRCMDCWVVLTPPLPTHPCACSLFVPSVLPSPVFPQQVHLPSHDMHRFVDVW